MRSNWLIYGLVPRSLCVMKKLYIQMVPALIECRTKLHLLASEHKTDVTTNKRLCCKLFSSQKPKALRANYNNMRTSGCDENEYGILLIIAAIIPTQGKPQVALVVYFCFVEEIVQWPNKLFEK